MANTEEKGMNILDYINYLIEIEGYSEENAKLCASVIFSEDFSEDN